MPIWTESFDTLDAARWNVRRGNWLLDANGKLIAPGWGNGELQYYTDQPDNLYTAGNALHIRALLQDTQDDTGARYRYTSARIDTRGKFAFRYGRLVFTAKLPVGDGLWPAVWLMPQDDAYGRWAASGEIDILEARGRLTGQVSHALHFGGPAPDNRLWSQLHDLPGGHTTADWHEYGVLWTPRGISFLVDGAVSAHTDEWFSQGQPFPAPFDEPFYIVVNLALGGWFDRGIAVDEKALPALMQVEPIRVYES